MTEESIKSQLSSIFIEAGFSPREGSAVYDTVISPLVKIIEPLYKAVENLAYTQALPFNSQSKFFLSTIGARYGVDRISSGTSSAYIKMVYSSPPDNYILIEGSEFRTSSGLIFMTIGNTLLRSSDFLYRDDGLYESLPIFVYAKEPGTEYNVQAGQINKAVSSYENLKFVYNPAPSSGGIATETDDSYAERILSSMSSRSMDTKNGALFVLKTAFPNMENISIFTSGSENVPRGVFKASVEQIEVPLKIKVQLSMEE